MQPPGIIELDAMRCQENLQKTSINRPFSMSQTVKLPEGILYNYSRVKCITAVDGCEILHHQKDA